MNGQAVVHATGPGAFAHAPAVPPGAVLAGASLVAAATVAGAWLARRRPGHREIWFAAAAGLAARAGCGCQQHKEHASGPGTAAALAAHRFLEGSAIALAGSAAVAVALAVHAFAEGLAIAAGVLAQAARVSLRAAFRGLRTSRLLIFRPAATTAIAGILTALAVHAAN